MTDEYAQFVQEVFQQFGPVSIRRMFGGYGIFHEGLMFGLVSRETLYLKTDAGNVSHFDTLGLGAFEYTRKGRTVRLSFHMAPEEILDDPEEAAVWARRSFEAALRSASAGASRVPGNARQGTAARGH